MQLIAGATGSLGMAVALRLAEDGIPVRALVRERSSEEKVAALRNAGVEIAVGDLKDRDSLAAACRGVDTVISTASSTVSRGEGDSVESVDRDGQLNLVQAAREAGVKRFILVSFTEIPAQFPLQDAKRAVEVAIRDSGMRYTILRPGYFMEAWLGPHLGFDAANGRVRIYGSGENPMSWISAVNVADFVVAAAKDRTAADAVIPLGGPEALTPKEAVRIFEEESGRKFEVEHVPVEALETQSAEATDSMQKTFAGLMLGYHYGGRIDMEEVLRAYPVELISVRDYARRVLGK